MNDTVLFVLIGVGIVLGFIGIIVIIKKSFSHPPMESVVEEEEYLDEDTLMEKVKDPNLSAEELMEVLETFNSNFKIQKAQLQKYLVFFSRALTHPNINADVFKYFHKEIKKNNLEYTKELDKLEKKALSLSAKK
ncbi:MAG: hypothetical protein GXO40_05695 [Epsilonproteobacteria bacterium]|nr:hypothetical protein [Campylobacterota bacterium]